MAQYVNPTSPCVGGQGDIDWEYFFAEDAESGQTVLIVKDGRDSSREPCIVPVDHEFAVAHEKGDGDARLTAQDLAIECLSSNSG